MSLDQKASFHSRWQMVLARSVLSYRSKNCQIQLKVVIGKEDVDIVNLMILWSKLQHLMVSKLEKRKMEEVQTFILTLYVPTLVVIHGKLLERVGLVRYVATSVLAVPHIQITYRR
jgi:hypothetical protein